MTDTKKYKSYKKDPLLFAEEIFGLVPQKIKPQYSDLLIRARKAGKYGDIKLSMFEPFISGKNLTWQQTEIFLAVKRAINGEGHRKIAIKSGHGIGKSSGIAILIIWFIFCHKNCKIPCTAPTQTQMHDVLWAELSVWHQQLPQDIKDSLEWTTSYFKVKESGESWFARARTARKEKPEALAGIHANDVMVIADEASGIDDVIFTAGKSALTNPNTIFIMISNPTRLVGYFYNAFNALADSFQTLSFNGEESPIVDQKFIDDIILENGINSDEYRIRVRGLFPRADSVDDKGYTQLIAANTIKQTEFEGFVGHRIMGIDPAGEGIDETVWVIRDAFRAQIVAVEKISNPLSIAQKTLTLMMEYDVKPQDIVFDEFGIGAKFGIEMAALGYRIVGQNVGEPASNTSRYLNKRAEYYWNVRDWLISGGELVRHEGWSELTKIPYRANLQYKVQIMPKVEMKKLGIKSPNKADALMLTFGRQLNRAEPQEGRQGRHNVKARRKVDTDFNE